jgi:uncharacterized protein (DUF305 family)
MVYFGNECITNRAARIRRHAMATALLENGTDIRFIQAMLGHESIQSTQIYTKLSVSKLKEVHTANHPAHETRQGEYNKMNRGWLRRFHCLASQSGLNCQCLFFMKMNKSKEGAMGHTITIDLPETSTLPEDVNDRYVTEMLAANLYHQGRISEHQACQMIGLTRRDFENLLPKFGFSVLSDDEETMDSEYIFRS